MTELMTDYTACFTFDMQIRNKQKKKSNAVIQLNGNNRQMK